MTDNEIIKVLECCSNAEPCTNCPYQKQCDETDLAEIALDLINRQKAEIERLEAKCENTQVGYNIARAEIEEYKAINKSLKADRPFLIANARAEAIKEFAEKLITEAKLRNHTNYGANKQAISHNEGVIEMRRFTLLCINKLVKEMVGED